MAIGREISQGLNSQKGRQAVLCNQMAHFPIAGTTHPPLVALEIHAPDLHYHGHLSRQVDVLPWVAQHDCFSVSQGTRLQIN